MIKRGYLRISKTPYSIIHCNHGENENQLNDYPLINKLVFGKRLTANEQKELYTTTNTSMLDYAIEKNNYETNNILKEYAR